MGTTKGKIPPSQVIVMIGGEIKVYCNRQMHMGLIYKCSHGKQDLIFGAIFMTFQFWKKGEIEGGRRQSSSIISLRQRLLNFKKLDKLVLFLTLMFHLTVQIKRLWKRKRSHDLTLHWKRCYSWRMIEFVIRDWFFY